MPVFKLHYNGSIVGFYKTREKLNNAIDKCIKENPEAKASMYVLIIWD